MMAYSEKFVVSVIVNNRPTRELNVQGKRTATIPFGSEYKIRLKNKNKVRSMASVYIDGTDVLCGSKIILGPNETIDLERFVDDNDKGNKFRFISLEQGEQTGEIQDPDNVENGRISVEFFREDKPEPIIIREPDYGILRSATSRGIGRNKKLGSAMTFSSMAVDSIATTNCLDATVVGSASASSFYTNTSIDSQDLSLDLPKEEMGATVEGSESSQKFEEGEDFDIVDKPTVLEIYLKGPSQTKVGEYEWALFVKGESKPRAQHVNKSKLIEISGSLNLPEDKELSFEKVFRKA